MSHKELLTKIAIILPTYNGESYLAAQLESLLSQSYKNFVIVTRDDGSSDSSEAIIAHYAAQSPQHFWVLKNNGENLGASANFSYMTQYVLSNKDLLGLHVAYLMFCDQDDVWLPHKIEVTMAAMLAKESVVGTAPVLVHSDLKVVDDKLAILSESLFSYQKLQPIKKSTWRLLISNTVTGCTVMINEALAQAASPIPQDAIMHDWWLALVASVAGDIVTLSEALVMYRQHESNTLGAREHRSKNVMRRMGKLVNDTSHEAIASDLHRQAAVFERCFKEHLGLKNQLRLWLMRSLGSQNPRIRTFALKALFAI